ncbi:MAG: ATP-binding protein [Chryseosolibacter sp.]
MLQYLDKLLRTGFLLVLVWAAFQLILSDRIVPAATGGGPTVAVAQSPLQESKSTPKEFDHGSLVLWLVLGVSLLGLSGYLLFQIKKKQLAAEQLEALRNELTHLFENAPCGYHSIDERGFFTRINKTMLGWLGYEKNEVVGKMKFTDVIAEAHREIIGNASLQPQRSFDIDLVRKSGVAFPVLLRVVKKEQSDRQRKTILFSTIDNGECRQALERIKTLDQELEAFSYSISHDLRAPLRSIDGYSKILQEDYAGKLDDDGRRVLNVIMNNARRMGKLIDDLLDFGRLGRKNLQRSNLNMKGIVHNIVNELLMREPDRKVDVKVDELHSALADADMMRQVWFNILENAVKFTGKKQLAAIEVRSYKTDGHEVCYEVKDNGEGFDMKYAPKLFGVFQRLHKMQDFAGTGVGLAIVKRIISRHGGRVWAEASLHQGAIFYFTIPIENENP